MTACPRGVELVADEGAVVVDPNVLTSASALRHAGRLTLRAYLSAVLPRIPPMLATLVPEPFHRDGWVFEEKVDGWRIVAHMSALPPVAHLVEKGCVSREVN